MPIPVVKKILAWSYSRYNDYVKCPFLAKCKHVDRLKEPDNPAMAGGTEAHKQGEDYVAGRLKVLPNRLKQFPKEFAKLRKLKAMVEKEWAFNSKWEPCGWFDKTAWLRIKVDAHYLVNTVVHVVDYKTGKEHEEHEQQRSLYALGAFLMYPYATEVRAAHWYLDQGLERASTYKAKELEGLKKQWLDRTARMLEDTRFAPRVNRGCNWCHFRKENGGPCKF